MVEIWSYIAADSPRAADNVLRQFREKAALATDHSKMGRTRPEIADDARAIASGAYLLLYKHELEGIVVVAVVHRMTDPKSWLD